MRVQPVVFAVAVKAVVICVNTHIDLLSPVRITAVSETAAVKYPLKKFVCLERSIDHTEI